MYFYVFTGHCSTVGRRLSDTSGESLATARREAARVKGGCAGGVPAFDARQRRCDGPPMYAMLLQVDSAVPARSRSHCV